MNLSNKNKLLAIGLSARMMVSMASQSGWQVVAIDVFGDVDTCNGAIDVYRVRSLSLFDVKEAVDEAIRCHALEYCIYASGFEANIDSLSYVSDRLVVLGNGPGCLARVCDKDVFFRSLIALSIPFPETRLLAPSRGQWLCKSAYSAGGVVVTWFLPQKMPTADSVYWQKYLDGDVVSATFIAHSKGADVIGFNRQWSIALGEKPFVFAGLMSNIRLSGELKTSIENAVSALVEHFGLRGLGSFDFIVEDDSYFALELNARISASSVLYGRDVFRGHVAACSGDYDGCQIDENPSAYRILFAERDVLIPNGLLWPDWVVDRPQPGSVISKGQPLCSIMVGGTCESDTAERLAFAEHFLRQLF